MPAIIPVAISGISTIASMGAASDQRAAASKAAQQARKDKKIQDDLMEQQKQEYRDIEFKNPYADMENTYEDLTVNQQQAQFQAQQGSQQRANIMQGLRGAAGSSGIAGLAQSLANQGQLQTQQASASIGLQESQNQQLKAKGAAAIQSQERQGEAMVQEAETGRQATLLGMQQSQAAGASAAYQQQLQNQQAANASASSMETSALTGLAGAAMKTDWGSIVGGGGVTEFDKNYNPNTGVTSGGFGIKR